MFRKPKKLPKVLRTLRVGSEEDEDNESDNKNNNNNNSDQQQQIQPEAAPPALLTKRRTRLLSSAANKSKNQHNKRILLHHEDEEMKMEMETMGDPQEEPIPMVLKTTSRMGYGGGGGLGGGGHNNNSKLFAQTEGVRREEERGAEEEDLSREDGGGVMLAETSTTVFAAVSYDKDSLSRLQAEQHYKHQQNQNLNTDLFPSECPHPHQYNDQQQQQLYHDGPWDTAAAAAAVAIDEDGGVNEDDSDWRQEPPDRNTTSTSSPTATANLLAPEERANKKLLSLQQLKESLTTTLTHISHQNLDHESRCQQMQQHVLQQTRDDLERQDLQLRETGRAVEYYQQLRQKLVDWVGALRQLQAKVIPIQRALHELESEIASNRHRRDWEMDMIAVLYRHNRLAKVLGNQPDDPKSVFDPLQTIQVDEFGRDVQSQSNIQREHRAKTRHRIQQQRAPERRRVRGDESDAYLSDGEKETFRERHDALQKALEVALHELDEEFAGLQNLVNVFETWRRDFPDDYQQCYASLSLADLASVLILTELCALNDPWNESGGYNEGKWIAVVKSALDSGILEDSGVERILEKSVYPSFSDLLHRSGYSLVSTRQAQALSSFLKHVMKIAPPDSRNLDKLIRKLEGYIEKSLSEISIPIVKNDTHHSFVSEELQEVIEGATVGQMHTLQKILLNVITYWGPLLGGQGVSSSSSSLSFAEVVLDFISNKFLFLLSSLQQDVSDSRFSESPADMFREVWDALLPTGWVTDPKLMLQTVAIRAAYSAYSSNC